MSLGTEKESRYTAELERAIADACRELGIKNGPGAPMAYFERPDGLRVTYVSFANGKEKTEGAALPETYDSAKSCIEATVKAFRDVVKPNRSLVWRHEPEVLDTGDGRFYSFMRFAQLEGDFDHVDCRYMLA